MRDLCQRQSSFLVIHKCLCASLKNLRWHGGRSCPKIRNLIAGDHLAETGGYSITAQNMLFSRDIQQDNRSNKN